MKKKDITEHVYKINIIIRHLFTFFFYVARIWRRVGGGGLKGSSPACKIQFFLKLQYKKKTKICLGPPGKLK